MHRLSLFLILLFLSPGCVAEPDYPAHVVGISNSETLTVLTAGKK